MPSAGGLPQLFWKPIIYTCLLDKLCPGRQIGLHVHSNSEVGTPFSYPSWRIRCSAVASVSGLCLLSEH
ncbi:hypothetical protein DUNSADRAFT_8401 [Dunaliella salina]|uniref:Encoded protein n=1 Tax=Dunaliella salina TaxID=3046 RepID=A0ABQ7GIJ6_DUNSA|nr:hypothetical protein DUNSADRAFT_8401 [Dunaliella salina]|eukprot:KAF5834817.1 hypothetical protein DUNSADRAFT_8401 [Dunaliella salina]